MRPRSAGNRAIALGAAAMIGFAASPAHALTCDPSHFPGVDQLFYPNISVQGQIVTTMRITQPTGFWAGMGVLAFNTSTDYDLKLYNACWSSTPLASSELGIGRTDFVLGDFNNDPTGDYAVDVYCYSGDCLSLGQYGAGTWRTGGFLFVDFAPTTITFNTGPPYSPDMVMRVFDVFMSAGSTYYFQFSSSLGSGAKMMLFRNPSNGIYWTGRNGAVFETSGCTTYTAPTTGYYGLVVVNDVWSFGTASVGVYSTPQCACAPELPARTPTAISSVAATGYEWTTQSYHSWAAIGERPATGSDWDLEVSTSGGSPGCPQTVLGNSVFGSTTADFVITDFNTTSVPTTLAARTYRYSGTGGTTIEWDRSATFDDPLMPNGPQVTDVWGSTGVLRCWDVPLAQGSDYTFQFSGSPNMKVFLFRNPGNGLYSVGRSGAVVSSTSTFTYTAPSTGYYGVVVAKDDDQTGFFALRVGTCESAIAITPGPVSGFGSDYIWASIAPSAGRWTALGTRCAAADWDVVQYGSTASASWPDCYSPTGVTSESASLPDFIVGDFHVDPPGTYPFRFKQFSSGPPEPFDVEWTGAAKPIGINDPALNATPSASEVLRIYEAYLVGGRSYQIGYSQSASRPLMVFGHGSSAPYWAPRNAALLSTLGSASFTPAFSGDYAFVIANDAAESGGFSLRINTTSLVGVAPEGPTFTTGFQGARPNPGADPALRYTLAARARVRFDLLDLSGRRVWSDDEGLRDMGEWSVALVRGAGPARIRPGLYFVKFEVDGRVVDIGKITLLD